MAHLTGLTDLGRGERHQGERHQGEREQLDARTQRRLLLWLDRRRARARAGSQQGQTLIIFALSFTVLLGLAGLAIDVARAYDLYAKMQLAADAGALAGVLYLPTYYNAARIAGDGQSAAARATAEVYNDGFGTGSSAIPAGNPCPAPSSSVEIAICQVSNAPTDLEVIITEHLNVVLLGGRGLGPITLQAHSQAEYLPPIQIGSRENYFGDQVECAPGNSSNTNTSSCQPGDTTQNHLQYFMATLDDPAELKESGDPVVYCAEGDADASSLTPNGLPAAPDPTPTISTYNGYPTDHPQWPGVPTGTTYTGGISQYCSQPVPASVPGTSDSQPPGYNGPATAGTPHDGGYNYIIGLAPGVAPATLWIYNPYYVPQDANSTPPPLDHFIDNTPGGQWSPNFYQGPQGEGIGASFDGVHHDAPLLAFAVTYSLYSVTNLYDRASDRLLATATFSPYDNTSADLALHGCFAGQQVYNPVWSGPDTPNWYHKQAQIQAGQGCAPAANLSPTCPTALAWCPLVNSGLWDPTQTLQNPQNAATLSSVVTRNAGSQGSAYRLVVEATGLPGCAPDLNQRSGCDFQATTRDGWGQQSYALKICASGPAVAAVNCPNGDGTCGAGGFNNTQVTVYGWNNDDVTFQEPLSTTRPNANYPQTSCVSSAGSPYACMDLGCITSAYAGRTITVGLFDPGDGAGDLALGIAPPPGATTGPGGTGSAVTIRYPAYAQTAQLDGDTVVCAHDTGGYRPYNGLWLNVTIQLSSTYQGDCASTGSHSGRSGCFQLAYIGGSATAMPTDKLAVEFTLVGSPVHLVPALLG